MDNLINNTLLPFIEKYRKSLIKSLLIATIFVILSLPFTYSTVFDITGLNVIDAYYCPTPFGHLLHTFIFFIIYSLIIFVYLLIFDSSYDNYTNFIYDCIVSTFIFYFLTNSETYKILFNMFSDLFSNFYGCPTIFGVLFGGFIYFVYKFIFFIYVY